MMEMMLKRTHYCGELSPAQAGEKITLNGWVHHVRNLGGLIFIELRDVRGKVQVILDPQKDLGADPDTIRDEWVIAVQGTLRLRPEEQRKSEDGPAAVELEAETLQILNRCKPLPYNPDDPNTSEDLRLKYRYLDMRRSNLAADLFFRSRVTMLTRSYFQSHGFAEVETPILSKSTPEGARDYLVPSRVWPGKFYALPQAPQQYKQLLMVGGIDRYFQIARCFRDEDLRADRQPEFTQIDVEMSFVTADDIIST
ncbi:MAG: aspartate--tRNA ligase, partial [Lentisphaerae bacterium]